MVFVDDSVVSSRRMRLFLSCLRFLLPCVINRSLGRSEPSDVSFPGTIKHSGPFTVGSFAVCSLCLLSLLHHEVCRASWGARLDTGPRSLDRSIRCRISGLLGRRSCGMAWIAQQPRLISRLAVFSQNPRLFLGVGKRVVASSSSSTSLEVCEI